MGFGENFCGAKVGFTGTRVSGEISGCEKAAYFPTIMK